MLFKLLLFLILLLAPVEGAPIGNRNQRSIPENKIQGGDNIVLPDISRDLLFSIAIGAAIVFVLVITAAAISTLIYRLRKNNKSRRDEEVIEYYYDYFYSQWFPYKKRESSGKPKGEHEENIKLIADYVPNGPKTENGDILEETKISVPGPPDVIISMPGEDVVTASGPPEVISMPGEDVVTASGPPDVIISMPGEDVVTASGPPDVIISMPDEEVVTASGPPDVIIGMPDEDVVTASDSKFILLSL
ncbi:uncharacterized protein LOC142246700 [Anomaloglossus baeobatrachus]|uniref:uncharacterized protein LOC142246700 n=1 Tax=Anomaloglossus baeobatrachus TaxID=238106 RepID=UPI003F5038EF